MIDIIQRHIMEGWKVCVNNNNQVVFTNTDDGTFFTLNHPNKHEREYIEFAKDIKNVRIRKRFIHR